MAVQLGDEDGVGSVKLKVDQPRRAHSAIWPAPGHVVGRQHFLHRCRFRRLPRCDESVHRGAAQPGNAVETLLTRSAHHRTGAWHSGARGQQHDDSQNRGGPGSARRAFVTRLPTTSRVPVTQSHTSLLGQARLLDLPDTVLGRTMQVVQSPGHGGRSVRMRSVDVDQNQCGPHEGLGRRAVAPHDCQSICAQEKGWPRGKDVAGALCGSSTTEFVAITPWQPWSHVPSTLSPLAR